MRFGYGDNRARMIGVWRSLVARFVRDEEVVGSNPATPTENEKAGTTTGWSRPSSFEGGVTHAKSASGALP